MSNNPTDLKYTKTHEWLRWEADDLVIIGITDHAQSAMGEVVFVELPEIGIEVKSQDECGVVESVKSAAEIYSPIHGEIVEVNEILQEEPGLINSDPYGDGWLYKMKPSDVEELSDLLEADDYKEYLDEKAD